MNKIYEELIHDLNVNKTVIGIAKTIGIKSTKAIVCSTPKTNTNFYTDLKLNEYECEHCYKTFRVDNFNKAPYPICDECIKKIGDKNGRF